MVPVAAAGILLVLAAEPVEAAVLAAKKKPVAVDVFLSTTGVTRSEVFVCLQFQLKREEDDGWSGSPTGHHQEDPAMVDSGSALGLSGLPPGGHGALLVPESGGASPSPCRADGG